MNTRFASLSAIAAIGLALSAMPASAAPAAPSSAPAAQQSITVSHAGLNLASKKGLKRLDARIAAAARKLCGAGQQITGTRIIDPDVHTCLVAAVASTRTQVAALVADADRQQLGG